jgi:type II secretory pathway pseudopilin PulG
VAGLKGPDSSRTTTADASRQSVGEGGSTLVELLAATAIMAIAVVTILFAMSTLFVSSGQDRQSTTTGIVTRDYSEALDLAVTANNWCASTYPVSYTPPSGYAVAATYGTCPANNTTTPQFQTVTITATSPNGATETLDTVIRQP